MARVGSSVACSLTAASAGAAPPASQPLISSAPSASAAAGVITVPRAAQPEPSHCIARQCAVAAGNADEALHGPSKDGKFLGDLPTVKAESGGEGAGQLCGQPEEVRWT